MMQKKKHKTAFAAAIDHLKKNDKIEKQDDIASALGYDKGVVSSYKTGKKAISDNFIGKFEDYYKIKLSDFEGEPGENKAKSPAQKDQEDYRQLYFDLLAKYNANSEDIKEDLASIAAMQRAEIELILAVSKTQVDHKRRDEVLRKYDLLGMLENTDR